MKYELLKIYTDLQKFVKDNLGDETRQRINSIYTDVDSHLQRNTDDLINSDCAIVVAGETGSGKSSFLNLLIGTDVLPYSLLSNTSAICQIHNSEKKKFKVVRENDESETFDVVGDGSAAEKDLIAKLTPYVGRSGYVTGNKIKHVDIYWPVPMIREHVTIVDTPGVGENREMTEKLVQYLPKAVAFIYIVNSANAGGIQEDTILHIISEQKKLDTEHELSSFDPRSMIFVCNKWDVVEKRGEADRTWQDTVRRLQMTIPGLREDHIFKLSVSEAIKYKKSGIGNTEKYQHLLEGLERFIPDSLVANIKRHYKWINSIISKLEVYIASRINNAKKSSEEKDEFLKTVMLRLSKLERDSELVRNQLIAEAQNECHLVTQELHKHLKKEDVISYLETWTEEEAPDIIENDLDVTKFGAQEMILHRLLNVIQTWESETRIVQKATQKLTRLFNRECFLLSQKCNAVDEILEGGSLSDTVGLILGRHSGPENTVDTDLELEASDIAIIAATAPIWIPLGIAALAIFIPVGIGFGVVNSIRNALERKEYRKDKAKFMRKWTLMLLDSLHEIDNISHLIEGMYLKSMIARINILFSDFIPRQIEADKTQLHLIVSDKRTEVQILHQFRPKKERVHELFQALYLFDLKYLANDLIGISKILRYRQIGSGNFSDVYRATWKQEDGSEKEVALKILKGHDMHLQLSEVDCSRRLKHHNLVEFYGVIFSGRERYNGSHAGLHRQNVGLPLYDNRLMLVLDLCDQSLESLVFGNKDLQCGSFSHSLRERKTYDFFFDMGVSICEGLAYMHRMKYLHRDLKLSNVLVKNGIGKLSDLGFARAEVTITGTAAGTLTHMAPELLKEKLYSYSSDVYSLSILMWELWYGKSSYSDTDFAGFGVGQFIDAVTRGARPGCDMEHAMMEDLKILVQKCWDHDPERRPKVENVTKELKKIDEKYRRVISR
ncbi:uncharacterized protein LOC123548286 isoform X2 [Mercenaria mercenaria]|nr:uncharacterized protein LOC123548286 isoform X2 [Mercenaria mercenaria]